MSNRKERLTVTVDPELIQAGQEAVAAGLATSLSAWVSAALAEHVLRERRLSALAEAIADYEAEFGEITEREMREQARADRASAEVVRGKRKTRGVARRRRAS
jgi:hypothetical protein